MMYRISPRLSATVTRLDRRGSVDSGLAQVYRLGGPRVTSTGRRGYDDQLHRSFFQAAGGPQVYSTATRYSVYLSCTKVPFTRTLRSDGLRCAARCCLAATAALCVAY